VRTKDQELATHLKWEGKTYNLDQILLVSGQVAKKKKLDGHTLGKVFTWSVESKCENKRTKSGGLSDILGVETRGLKAGLLGPVARRGRSFGAGKSRAGKTEDRYVPGVTHGRPV